MLSGQHITEALKRRQEDYVRERRVVPEVYRKVRATVLAPDTPLSARQMYAGDVQNAQTAVQALTIPEFAQLLLRERDLPTQADRLAMAFRKSGWQRTGKEVRLSSPVVLRGCHRCRTDWEGAIGVCRRFFSRKYRPTVAIAHCSAFTLKSFFSPLRRRRPSRSGARCRSSWRRRASRA